MRRLLIIPTLLLSACAGSGTLTAPSGSSSPTQLKAVAAAVFSEQSAKASHGGNGGWLDLQGDQPLTGDGHGGVYFTLSNGRSQNYLWTTAVPRSLTGTLSLTINVANTSGVPAWFVSQPGCSPSIPEFRLWFYTQHYGTYFGTHPYDEWWAYDRPVALGPGTFTLAVSVDDLARWRTWDGEIASDSAAATTGLTTAAEHPAGIGGTFGDDCFYGHGAGVNGGSVKVAVTAPTVN